MEKIIKEIAGEIQKLSDTMLTNIGKQSFYIVNAYHNSDYDNCYIYDAEFINIGELIESNFKNAEIKKEKILLNKRGTVLGFIKGLKTYNNKNYAYVSNFSMYFSNSINSRLQYTDKDIEDIAVVIDVENAQPLVTFETLVPKKDVLGNDVIEDGKVVYDIKDIETMPKNKLARFKKEYIEKIQSEGILPEKTYFRVQYIPAETMGKSSPKEFLS